MREREVKVLNIDKDEIEKKLKKIGAVLLKDEEQTNIRFDTDNNYLKETYNGYLRIRTTKNLLDGKVKNTLTFKKSISRDKMRVNEETETEISNCEETIKILEFLGYNKKRPGYKHRRSYSYDHIIFEIDTWDKDTYSKPYLEIEMSSEDELEKAIKLLQLDRKQITTKSIFELRKD
ncbi:adenylate cyclase class 2 [Sedimentibacter acidaminivorans]|uniref:Adenylate cyclase class 2 n=1 Tax=Sedimentibacter acidaminivorans TaxID=913099 RepID=A0ABS4GDL5_9FIRM|nr:class IV adenylate cyclase [Sedimentibacter acidaminivorans]MBP1925793.1 adenylate cyclase class 2 [Sedimentibacter acidaminivorans]